MATSQYLAGRRKYSRPQAILFSETQGTKDGYFWIPDGYEVGTEPTMIDDTSLVNNFLILSDDNRKILDFKPTRIESRQRTINGRMRSYHIADKMELSISWDMLPSRAFSGNAGFNTTSGAPTTGYSSGNPAQPDSRYTTDGGAGGVELLDWYNNHQGSFWVFLAYDNYKELGLPWPSSATNNLSQYNEVIEMFISDFSYSVVSRGGSNHDMWNVSITLEEA